MEEGGDEQVEDGSGEAEEEEAMEEVVDNCELKIFLPFFLN
jgi:hypothetical protein